MFLNLHQEEDEQLAVLIKQADRQSMEILYDKYAPALFGIICRITNNEKLAAEILKKSFANALTQISGFNSSGISLFSWLINIARQSAFEEIIPEQVLKPETDKNVYETAGNENTGDAAFKLAFYKGMSCTEACKKLGLTQSQFKNYLRLSIRHLIKKQQKHEQ